MPPLSLFLIPFLFVAAASAAEPNYDQHIKPLLRQHCLKCHGNDEQESGLNLQTYAAAMKGSNSGEIVVPGRSSQSLMYQIISDPDDDFRMPPSKPMIPQEHITLIQRWIDGGLLENAGSKSSITKRNTSFRPAVNPDAKPIQPAMPESLPEIDPPETTRRLPVLAMAASPWAPLVAVAGQEHVRLLHVDTEEELGKLPFPEGIPHVIRFSRDGTVLLVAGGRPVESGSVVLFDVKSGTRLASIGDELDAILAADISPDQSLVALGGTGKTVKVYATSSGIEQYKIEKHTDWVTTVAFSPNGNTLATADRAGGLHLWDATSGGIVLSLLEHKASVRALDWRSDSNFLASAGEDGRVIWWDVNEGWPTINKANAHPPARPPGTYGALPNGILAARFGNNGTLATTGRDQVVRLWNTEGEALGKLPSGNSLPISTAISHDGNTVISGSSDGTVRFWRPNR